MMSKEHWDDVSKIYGELCIRHVPARIFREEERKL